jgi:hypothetical protein
LFVDDLMRFGKPIEAHSELIESRSIANQLFTFCLSFLFFCRRSTPREAWCKVKMKTNMCVCDAMCMSGDGDQAGMQTQSIQFDRHVVGRSIRLRAEQ